MVSVSCEQKHDGLSLVVVHHSNQGQLRLQHSMLAKRDDEEQRRDDDDGDDEQQRQEHLLNEFKYKRILLYIQSNYDPNIIIIKNNNKNSNNHQQGDSLM